MPGRVVVGLALVALVALAGGLVVVAHTDAAPLLGSITVGPDPSAVAVDEGANRVFVTDHVDGYLRVLDAGSGALLHTVAIDRDGPLAIDEQHRHVFLAGALNGPDKYGVYSDHAVVRMLDARTGSILRTVTTNVAGDAGALVVDAPARRVFAIFPATALVLDTRSGAILRTVAAAPSARLAALDARSGRVFVTNGGDSVSMFDARQGTALRTIALGGTPTGVAVDEQSDHVFLPTGNGIAMLDARSGALWRTVRAGHPFDAVTVDEQTGRAFVSSAVDNSVDVLDTRDGAVVRIVRAGRPPHVAAVDARSGRVFIGSQGSFFTSSTPTGAGSISVLDARDGNVLHTIALGDVTGVAVDARTGRAFVINRDARTVPAFDRWSWIPPWLRGRLPLIPRPAPRTVSIHEAVSVLDATR